MVIRVLDLVQGCSTNDEGAVIYDAIKASLVKTGQAVVSFDGVSYATSSFVNSAFLGLLDDMTLEEVKERLSIVRSRGQINNLVRRIMTDPPTRYHQYA